VRRLLAACSLAVAVTLAGCGDDADEAAEDEAPNTTVEAPPDLDDDTDDLELLDLTDLTGHLLEAEDLPGEFVDSSSDVADTITTICAGQDATAGLQATGRAVAGFRREPPGVSVVQVVLELPDGDARSFVEAARQLLGTCDGVPDPASALAFFYEPVDEGIDEVLAAATEDHVARRGVSVGSEAFVIDLAFFRVGDLGQLVAVLGFDEPMDGLLESALEAALTRLQG
jgi:hypothetical protein